MNTKLVTALLFMTVLLSSVSFSLSTANPPYILNIINGTIVTSGGAGTVTSITAGQGLTGGIITSFGTITLDNSFMQRFNFTSQIASLNNYTYAQIASNIGNYSADKAGLYTNISTALTIASNYYPNISGLQASNITTNLRITAVNNSLSNYATITYVNALNNVSLATIQARIDANGNWTLDKVNYATLAYVNALNNVSQATVQALINANGNYSRDQSAIYSNITALQSNPGVNYYSNVTTAQNSIYTLVLNLSSVGNYSANAAEIYANITAKGKGNITGAISSGYVPYASNGSRIINSNIYQSGSNIGIGTASPGAKLDVYGGRTYLESSDGYSLGLNVAGSNRVYMYMDTSANLTFTDTTGYSAGHQLMTIQQAGNVGIGSVSPLTLLSVGSGSGAKYITLTDTSSAYHHAFIGKNGNSLQFGDSSLNSAFAAEPRMSLNISNGNLGIGTTAPAQKLDVVGNVNATYYYGDGSRLSNISSGSGGNASWNESYANTLFAPKNYTTAMQYGFGGVLYNYTVKSAILNGTTSQSNQVFSCSIGYRCLLRQARIMFANATGSSFTGSYFLNISNSYYRLANAVSISLNSPNNANNNLGIILEGGESLAFIKDSIDTRSINIIATYIEFSNYSNVRTIKTFNHNKTPKLLYQAPTLKGSIGLDSTLFGVNAVIVTQSRNDSLGTGDIMQFMTKNNTTPNYLYDLMGVGSISGAQKSAPAGISWLSYNDSIYVNISTSNNSNAAWVNVIELQ